MQVLKISAILPSQNHYHQIAPRDTGRFQWADKATDAVRIVSPVPDPWVSHQKILLRITQGKTRGGLYYPKRLDLVVLPSDAQDVVSAKIIRERWKGLFAYSEEPTLRFFAFPVEDISQKWLMMSILSD
jgi:hypothetical protein